MNNNKLIYNQVDSKVFEYENGSVVFLFPGKVYWIKTSISGKWIFEQMKNKEYNRDEIKKHTAEYYGLPVEKVSDSIDRLIDEFMKVGVLIPENGKIIEKKTPSLEELSLQQLWFNITGSCNLKCEYCYQLDNGTDNKHIETELWKSIIDQASEMNIYEIVISGGEPTTHPEFDKIINYIKKKADCKIKLITNGSTGDKKLIKKIVQQVDDIQVSIDGINEETHDNLRGNGSFKKILNFFGEVLTVNPDKTIGISFTPLPENIEQIPELFEFSNKLNAKYIHLNRPKIPRRETGREKYLQEDLLSGEFFEKILIQYENLLTRTYESFDYLDGFKNAKERILNLIDTSFDPGNEVISNIKKLRCSAGILTMAVDQNGDIYPCSALSSRESYGNLKELALKDAYSKLRKAMTDSFSVETNSSCKSCDFKYFCGGGCRATNENLNEKDRICSALLNRYSKIISSIPVQKREIKIENDEDIIQVENKIDLNC